MNISPFNPCARDAFSAFFGRGDTFALGVCNGCQVMSALKDLIPGAGLWPRFESNKKRREADADPAFFVGSQ